MKLSSHGLRRSARKPGDGQGLRQWTRQLFCTKKLVIFVVLQTKVSKAAETNNNPRQQRQRQQCPTDREMLSRLSLLGLREMSTASLLAGLHRLGLGGF